MDRRVELWTGGVMGLMEGGWRGSEVLTRFPCTSSGVPGRACVCSGVLITLYYPALIRLQDLSIKAPY